MKGKDLISVVIPAYNAEHFIKNAILSIFKQSYRPIEIVVVNDSWACLKILPGKELIALINWIKKQKE
jgi:cellulose synthase/poly-beta-1,6-N-acetylglucosamine synthase-like glycosyltransferase